MVCKRISVKSMSLMILTKNRIKWKKNSMLGIRTKKIFNKDNLSIKVTTLTISIKLINQWNIRWSKPNFLRLTRRIARFKRQIRDLMKASFNRTKITPIILNQLLDKLISLGITFLPILLKSSNNNKMIFQLQAS